MSQEKERAMIEDHEKRLEQVEKNQQLFSSQMETMQGDVKTMQGDMKNMQGDIRYVKTGLTELENTVLKGHSQSQEIQAEIKEMQQNSNEKVDKVFDLLFNLVQGNQQAETKISVAELDTKTKVIGIVFGCLFGAGGLLEILQQVAKLFR
ncbi:MAG TPA: hypothetical protein VFK37_06000 [Bacillales bacterium]|nr:hypothetical protein [Bacillales bacterium]